MEQYSWEWYDADWTPYDDETKEIMETAFQGAMSSVKLSHGFFGEQGGFTIYFDSMTQINDSTSNSRQIRRTPPAEPRGPVWMHLNPETEEWEDFDNISIRLLEGCVKNKRCNITLAHGDWAQSMVDVDIHAMAYTKRKSDDEDAIYLIKREPELTEEQRPKPFKGLTSSGEGYGQAENKKVQEVKSLTKWKEIYTGDVQFGQTCVICMCPLVEDQDEEEFKEREKRAKEKEKKKGKGKAEEQEEEKDKGELLDDVVKLSECGPHYFHKDCIVHYYASVNLRSSRDGFLTCPCCSTVYGVRLGTMPAGTFSVTKHAPGGCPLSGYEDVGTIVISESFPSGTQGPEHPHPGEYFEGTSRSAYLPDNKEGRTILKLFRVAWDRRLLFTVGRSVTTGNDNCVIWNGIHHKTNTTGGPTSFGYPDPEYFARVKLELEAKGVTMDDISMSDEED